MMEAAASPCGATFWPLQVVFVRVCCCYDAHGAEDVVKRAAARCQRPAGGLGSRRLHNDAQLTRAGCSNDESRPKALPSSPRGSLLSASGASLPSGQRELIGDATRCPYVVPGPEQKSLGCGFRCEVR